MSTSAASRAGPTVRPPTWRLPVAFLVAAAVAQVAGAVALAIAADELADGLFYGPVQLGVVHLYGLAMLTMAIAGALAQLVPVITRQRLASDTVLAGTGLALSTGAWLMALGLWDSRERVAVIGGILAATAATGLVAQSGLALTRAARGRTLGDSGLGIALSIGWLAATIVLGVVLLAERSTPFLDVDRSAVLATHAVIAIGGWIGGAVIAVGLRLVPMFSLAHGHRATTGQVALALWHTAVVLIAVGLIRAESALVGIGAALGVGAALSFGAFLLDANRHRHRAIDTPARHMAMAATAAVVAFGAILAGTLDLAGDVRAGIIAVLAGIVGIGAGATSGQLFKILPMIVWTGRHSAQAGTPGAPRLVDMQPRFVAGIEQSLFGVGLALLLVGVGVAQSPLVRLGALLLTGAALAVLAMAVSVLLGHGAAGRSGAGRPLPRR